MGRHAGALVDRRSAPSAAGAVPRVRRVYPRRPWYDGLSAVLHAVIAAVGLVVLSPLFLVISALVKLSSPGPAFYRGERVGRGGRRFRIVKFRTMVQGAEQTIGGRLLSEADKHRLCTRIGRLLKKSKLDEMPQLLNVVTGHMRLVGPRPLRPVFYDSFTSAIPEYAARFVVAPGITGIAQLRGGYYTSPRNKLRYDLVYVRRRSYVLDASVVALTFVKILNRWLSMGLAVLFLFLFVSLVPGGLQPSFAVTLFGVRVSAVSLAIVLLAGWTLVRRGPTAFSLYRCPLNVAIPLFALVTAGSAATSASPAAAVQSGGYYLVTGLLLAFLIVNTLATREFLTLTVRMVALTSVAVSLLGLVELFVANYAGVALRMSSVMGSPVELAVYLLLGIPLLLAEVMGAQRRRVRDFWVACATVSLVGIVFTQTLVGLVALVVTGAIFLLRRRRPVASFATAFATGVALLSLVAAPALFSGPRAAGFDDRVRGGFAGLPLIDGTRLLLGSGGPGVESTPSAAAPGMHATLLVEHGVAGWLVMMWVIVSAVRMMAHAARRMRDVRLRRTLWAIVSSVVGFVVSMNAMATFHHLAIQIFFWSLVGIGLGIATHLGRARRLNLIWRFGDSGD